jgi:hypothetical protein
MSRSEHERGPEQHHLAVVAIRERDEALLRAGKAEGEAESLRQQLARAVELTDADRRFIERILLRSTAGPDRRYAETIVAILSRGTE